MQFHGTHGYTQHGVVCVERVGEVLINCSGVCTNAWPLSHSHTNPSIHRPPVQLRAKIAHVYDALLWDSSEDRHLCIYEHSFF